MEKKMENELETAIIWVVLGSTMYARGVGFSG